MTSSNRSAIGTHQPESCVEPLYLVGCEPPRDETARHKVGALDLPQRQSQRQSKRLLQIRPEDGLRSRRGSSTLLVATTVHRAAYPRRELQSPLARTPVGWMA